MSRSNHVHATLYNIVVVFVPCGTQNACFRGTSVRHVRHLRDQQPKLYRYRVSKSRVIRLHEAIIHVGPTRPEDVAPDDTQLAGHWLAIH